MDFQRASVGLLAAGTIGIGVLGLARPERLARIMGTDESSARALGARDLVNGALLLIARDKRPVLATLALASLRDAAQFGRTTPPALAGSLAAAALAAVAYARS